MSMTISLDTSRFDRALRDWKLFARQSGKEIVTEAARGFIKRVVAVTPPSSGTANKAAQKAGETTIKADLAKLFIPVQLKGKFPERWPDLAKLHDAARTNRGRVRATQRYFVDQRKLAALQKVLISRVGLLAAGWNAAAEKLGVSLPAWIRRHGTGNGFVEIVVSPKGITVTMRNAVPFVDAVDGFDRRAQAALNYQAAAMERRTQYMIEKTARQAGFR
jgi:hypothetical protein